jgi:hypothetical protein
MPLLKGKKNIGRNITELEDNGSRPRSHKQIVAIALHVAKGDPAARLKKVPIKKK